MSRYFMIQSWVGSHENEPDYNGQQCGERNVRSSEVVPLYDQFGNANVSAFSDEAIAARTGSSVKPKSSVSIRDKILPQMKRVNTLTDQIIELESAYKSGEMSQAEYTMLRAVLYMKRDRAIELYKKAISLAQSRNESPEDSVESDAQNGNGCATTAQQEEIVTGRFLDEISSTNSLKLFAQRALQAGRVLVRCMQQAKAYIQTLKEV